MGCGAMLIGCCLGLCFRDFKFLLFCFVYDALYVVVPLRVFL